MDLQGPGRRMVPTWPHTCLPGHYPCLCHSCSLLASCYCFLLNWSHKGIGIKTSAFQAQWCRTRCPGKFWTPGASQGSCTHLTVVPFLAYDFLYRLTSLSDPPQAFSSSNLMGGTCHPPSCSSSCSRNIHLGFYFLPRHQGKPQVGFHVNLH